MGAPHRKPAILIDSLFFSYGNELILQNLSASIPQGEIWALVGKSGSGKSTLLQIVAGLFRPDSGDVTVLGREKVTAGRIKGVVFQDESLLGWLSIIENVTFPDKPSHAHQLRRMAEYFLREVGLEHDSLRYPHELSMGMKKRAEFARALVRDYDFFLADEPFGTLDALTRKQLWSLWQNVRKENSRTGLLCTHDPEEAIRLCDAVVTLKGSRPAEFGAIVRVPASVKQLGISEPSKELTDLIQRVTSSL